MRKVRDYDAELKALGDKAKALKARKVEQHGQLVAMTGADALDVEMLAGVLLDAVAASDTDTKEAWRVKGIDFFQRRGRKSGKTAPGDIIAAATATDNDAAGGSNSQADG
ncbi:conjugal transfer protein TraD [Sphingomonas glacialis]|uniref:Conjugal transfer protein TraD n=1 Tax=Sphingomonas glacialis TaxID=658225 RepID=A0A502FSJ1_9SPHN|nr:conjugal transfer protein TraD [Sphingomonas glacialis]TPG52212.1 conjugal transfer protein TraD [Sphingomonas glacialis]